MASTPEGEVKGAIKKALEDAKVCYSMKTTMGYGKSGWPDFDVVLRGVYVTIEAKYDARGKGPTALQRDNMRQIRESGGVTLVIDITNHFQLGKLIADVDQTLSATGYITPAMVRAAARARGIFYEAAVYDN